MPLIHKNPINLILRRVLQPFKSTIPSKFHFAINGTETIKLTEGKSMLFHANPTSNLLRVLFWRGIEGFEFAPYKVFVKLAKRSNVFFDIGANIGYYSLVAKIFNPKITVHGFEPLPSANKYFKINVELNKLNDITVHEVALTNFNGTARFFSNLNPRFPNETDHLYGDNSLNSEATGNIKKIEFDVRTQTLDSFVIEKLESSQKIDLIKLDTEGTENLVLEGANNVLSHHRPIIMCEVIKGFIERELEKILLDHQYKFYEVNFSGLKEVTTLKVDSGKLDFFFVPIEKTTSVSDLLAKY
jgi:FkbM family methyltransferase